MAKGDQVSIRCPYCGETSTYTQRNENGTQNETCAHCHKLFSVELSNGKIVRVRK